MRHLLCVLLISLVSSLSMANEFEDADKAWAPGKPWPAHWGLVKYPYTEAWNVVLIGFVNNIYAADEVGGTWLKKIPEARQDGAAVEICMIKAGLIKRGAFCQPALVDRELVGTLKEDDIVAFFYPNHGTKRFSTGPGSDGRTTLRVFQKLMSAGSDTCWVREAMVYLRLLAPECFRMVDAALVERILTRDFGPRLGDTASIKVDEAPANVTAAVVATGSAADPESRQVKQSESDVGDPDQLQTPEHSEPPAPQSQTETAKTAPQPQNEPAKPDPSTP